MAVITAERALADGITMSQLRHAAKWNLDAARTARRRKDFQGAERLAYQAGQLTAIATLVANKV